MSVVALAMGCILLAQAETDPFKPQLVPSQPPPVAIEEEPTPATATPAEPTEPQPASPLDTAPSEPAAVPGDAVHKALPTDVAPETNLAPLDSVPRQRLRPPELLAEALATPREGALDGQPLELVQALSRTPDRQQQLRIAQAYWRLSVEQAAYHWALGDRDMLNRVTQAHATLPEAASAVAAAGADVRDAQLAVIEAQQQLGDLVGLSGDRLPLAVDRPHAGSYNTLYDDIFGRRAAPPRIRLIHRTLPVRRKAIDAHGAAIVAARDAVEASGDEIHTSGQGLAAMLSLVDQLKHEQHAFLSAVRDYNQQIAEYLLAVARPGTSDQVLVSRMILSTSPAPRQPATPRPARESTSVQPTLPAGSPPVEAGADARTSNYRAADADALVADGGLYRGLLDLHPPARVQKLSGLLHWDRALPADDAQPTELAECLRGLAPEKRAAVLDLYWRARQHAAAYQVLNDQAEQISALSSAVVGLAGQPGMAEAGVRLQAARRAARAAVVDAQLALLISQFELTQAAGRPLEQGWLLPATPPQAGRYVVAESLQGAPRQWAERMNLRHEELLDRADAVVRADELRAGLAPAEADATPAAATTRADDSLPFDRALRAVSWQTVQTLAFLDGLTEYNLAIARYALATSSPSIPSEELVKKLVVARATRG